MRRMLVLVIGCLLLTGCGTPDDAGPSASGSSGTGPAGELTVFAAASLTKTFTAMGDALMARHPGLRVRFVFAGSSDLVAQLDAGAPGDVFAGADERSMADAVDASLIEGGPTVFATNHLTIATAPGNPLRITGLADLARPGLKIVVCAPQVPCGGATARVSELAGVTLTPVSEEPSVTGVLAKVTSGEADAGLVYRTDAIAAGGAVTAVDFPEADAVTNRYPVGVLAGTGNAQAARAFIDFVLSAGGQQLLTDAGFGGPAG